MIAHRGASHHYPPNTLEAFRAAITLGADGVELDVRLTAEGIPVVHHDAKGPDGQVLSRTAYRDIAAWIPPLEAVLSACEGLRLVNIELKNPESDPDFDPERRVASTVVELVSRLGMTDRTLISSFDAEALSVVRAIEGAPSTAYLVVDPTQDLIEATAAGGHTALNPWFGFVDRALMRSAAAVGLDVHPWTVDRPDDLARLAELGVASVITNRPDIARSLLGEPTPH